MTKTRQYEKRNLDWRTETDLDGIPLEVHTVSRLLCGLMNFFLGLSQFEIVSHH